MNINQLINQLSIMNNISISEVNSRENIVLSNIKIHTVNDKIYITGLNESLETYTYKMLNPIHIQFDGFTIQINIKNEIILIEEW